MLTTGSLLAPAWLGTQPPRPWAADLCAAEHRSGLQVELAIRCKWGGAAYHTPLTEKIASTVLFQDVAAAPEQLLCVEELSVGRHLRVLIPAQTASSWLPEVGREHPSRDACLSAGERSVVSCTDASPLLF